MKACCSQSRIRLVWCRGRSLFGTLIALSLVQAVSAQTTPPTPVVNSPQVPPDVSIPSGFAENPIAFFDDYS